MQKIEPASFGTHDGTFHADEVTACALLLRYELIDRKKIHRTRDAKILDDCEFVCDVGGIYDPKIKRFDHHQADYDGEMSSAGMILLYLKEQKILTDSEYHHLNRMMVMGVDAHDNGKDPQIPGLCTYSHVIASWVPVPYDVEDAIMNRSFFEAVDFALGHLERLLHRFDYIQSCKPVVEKAMQESDTYLFFEKKVPWVDLFFELGGESHPAKFVIMPADEQWILRGIPPSPKDKMSVRVKHPEQWAGKLTQELEEVSGIEGGIFCHKGRFISVWKTKEGALTALKKIL